MPIQLSEEDSGKLLKSTEKRRSELKTIREQL